MHSAPASEHHPLCTIEMVAAGHADRCPGASCAFWDQGCVLARIESELDQRPEVAAFLLELRRALVAGKEIPVAKTRASLARALGDDRMG